MPLGVIRDECPQSLTMSGGATNFNIQDTKLLVKWEVAI